MKNITAICALIFGMSFSVSAVDRDMGEVFLTGANYCPTNSVDANGQLLQIGTNTGLFSLYGISYGGDGKTTFGVPKLTPPNAKMRYCVSISGTLPERP